MDQHSVEIAERQLDRVLGFASRIENKVSVLLAIDLGITAVILGNLDYKDISMWYVAIPLFLALAMTAQSIFHLYRATYPDLKGGQASLIYFAEIAKRTEQRFVKDFSELTADALYNDLLGQVWRNSQIMNAKFASVSSAFVWTLCGLVPWTIFLVVSSAIHNRAIVIN